MASPAEGDAPPEGVVADHPLERLSTFRSGGPAQWFVRARSEAHVAELLQWARRLGLSVNVVGSGSNLLVADEGVRGLVLKLDGELARIEVDGERLCCGAGVRLPAVAARTAQLGLTGLEFGVNIPGTVGGAVRMNANAYGGELARTLEWADLMAATGAVRRTAAELGLAYRRSSIAPGEVVLRASFRLRPASVDQVRACLTELRARRHAAQPQGIRTFGSTFKNPDDPRAEGCSAGVLLDRVGCRGLRRGAVRFSPEHANFVQNLEGAGATADAVELIAEGRRRVLERFGVELEPEVQTLGPVRFPWR